MIVFPIDIFLSYTEYYLITRYYFLKAILVEHFSKSKTRHRHIC